MLRNQPLLNDKHFFFLHIQGLNPMMTPPLKMDYDKSRRKQIIKEYNNSNLEKIIMLVKQEKQRL